MSIIEDIRSTCSRKASSVDIINTCIQHCRTLSIRVHHPKRLDLEQYSLHNILQVLSVTPFCYDELSQLFKDNELQLEDNNISNQLSLFDL